MRGHIRERSPGHWAIVIDTRDANGRRKRRWFSHAGTKRTAQIECARLIAEIDAGLQIDPNRLTLAAFLERWIEHMRGQVSPRSLERYAELCRKNLVPLLGGVALNKLQPATISQAYAKALTSGRRDGQGGLSPRTVHHMHRVLRQALQQAVQWQLLARNPADLVKPPKVERKQMRTLDTDGTVALIEAARGTDMLVPILLGVLCGLRRGEVTALRWRSVDLEAGAAGGGRQHRADRSGRAGEGDQERQGPFRRPIAHDRGRAASAPDQAGGGAVATGRPAYRRSSRRRPVDGQPLQPRSLTHAFVKFIRRHGLPQIRLHDLRHSHATHMLAAGVHPKIAQERLGHSSVSVTIDLYSHVLPGMQAEAVSRVDAAMQDALNRRAAKKKW